MPLCPCTDNCKVSSLHETTKSSINCNQLLSSAESFAVQLNGGFGRAHHADASTEVRCQTVEHTPRPDLRCPEWSATQASFDTATLLLGPFPHGFSRANVHPRWILKSFKNGAQVVVVTHRCDDLATKKHVFWSFQFTAKSKCPIGHVFTRMY